ncbi:hypothetical protein BURCENBC7_AP4116 [Burkholderia cenocepacia BC7]|nr:hypothetical protein BURCENBC7_AP4116 [Burkholderia cenocepacia BC7]
MDASVCHAARRAVPSCRNTGPEIRTTNPEFRIDAARRCIGAYEAIRKDTFGSVSREQARACVATVRHAPGPGGGPERTALQAASKAAARDTFCGGGMARGA